MRLRWLLCLALGTGCGAFAPGDFPGDPLFFAPILARGDGPTSVALHPYLGILWYHPVGDSASVSASLIAQERQAFPFSVDFFLYDPPPSVTQIQWPGLESLGDVALGTWVFLDDVDDNDAFIFLEGDLSTPDVLEGLGNELVLYAANPETSVAAGYHRVRLSSCAAGVGGMEILPKPSPDVQVDPVSAGSVFSGFPPDCGVLPLPVLTAPVSQEAPLRPPR